jgi:7-cyano-7-deazaguanine synthase
MSGTAVLFSGGLDSAVLVAQELTAGAVQPIHVRAGLAWEPAEAATIARLLRLAPFAGRVRPLATLALDMRDVYGPTHWAVTGHPPAYDTPDEDVYLDGRNIVLASKAAVLCARLGIARLALGPLAGNPFPDATPAFLETMSTALTLGLGQPLRLDAPFRALHKADVIRLGDHLGVPLAETLSCMNPQAGGHCGVCSKCRERIDAFREAGIVDRTVYERAWPGSVGPGQSTRV